MIIDKERLFTPFRTLGNSITFTDHYAIQISFKGIPFAHKKDAKSFDHAVRWNTNRKEGWKVYEELTTNNDALDEAAAASIDSDKLMNNIEKEMTNVKFKAFGKVKVRKKRYDKNLIQLQSEKAETLDKPDGNEKVMKLQQLEERMANTVLVKQRECFVNETARLRDIRGKKGPTAALFRLKESGVQEVGFHGSCNP